MHVLLFRYTKEIVGVRIKLDIELEVAPAERTTNQTSKLETQTRLKSTREISMSATYRMNNTKLNEAKR